MRLTSKQHNYVRCRTRMERLIALLLLAAIWPVLLFVSCGILVTLGRPILFKQERVGQYGHVFSLVKFRTMVPNAEAIGGGYMPSELNLVPPFGAFLRRLSLDELPQLVNIVRGEMSFIGPRPALPDQYERYTDRQAQRCLVPPGVTGLAQVRVRNNAPWSKRIEYDLQYISTIGLRADFRIVRDTIRSVVTQNNVLLNQTATEVDDLGEQRLRRVRRERKD